MQSGYACVGLGGVESWHTKGKRELLPELKDIECKGREVRIVFDSDAVDNPNVRKAEQKLTRALTKERALVKVVRIPSGPDGKKLGADDFIVANGVEAFRELIKSAGKPEQIKVLARDLLPEEEGASILASEIHDGVCTTRSWRDEVYRWDDGAYRIVPQGDFKAEVIQRVNAKATKVGREVVGNIIAQVKGQSNIKAHHEPPVWLDGDSPWPVEEMIIAQNGIWHLPSLADGIPDAFIPPTPRLFALNALPYKINPDATKPKRWLRFLDEVWGDTPDCIDLLQEWMGYTLTNDTRQQKILFGVGPKRSGKGTICRVHKAMLGAWNVAGPTLASFSQNFGLVLCQTLIFG